ncbi:MAG: NAD+ synthase [Anaerolineae bacterium]
MRITLAQLDPVVGDIAGNVQHMRSVLKECAAEHPDLVIFPELYICGYPPQDLLERSWFIRRVQAAIQEVAKLTRQYPGTGILFGAPLPNERKYCKGLDNAAVLAYDGIIQASQAKRLLPTYDVFDEARYFDPAQEICVIPFKGQRLGVHVCEDAWSDPSLWPKGLPYEVNPISVLSTQNTSLLINLSASPFQVGKECLRYQLLRRHARRSGAPFIYLNQVGANDQLIFDGRSVALNAEGQPLAVLPSFMECVRTIDMSAPPLEGGYQAEEDIKTIYDALVLGIRDYMAKTGFKKAVLGLSGGIDSSLVACLAAAALGKENVLGVAMPSPISSAGSLDDARQLAVNLGIGFQVVPIAGMMDAYSAALADTFAGTQPNTTEENIQARIRGNILMALSNKFGYLVLSTGNKSELAVGYCTLYGDMSGGLAVISDVPKTTVYSLARYINRSSELIPNSCITKPPSAELRPNQTDQDSLPPYDLLDRILQLYIEEGCSADEITEMGLPEATVHWVVRTVDRNEYKRQQAAPGLRVTSKAFGVGRRMPIAARLDH